jgi:hypothetical protein
MEIDIVNAAKDMNMTQLCTTLLFTLAYHPATILSCIGIADKPPLAYLRMWLTWGVASGPVSSSNADISHEELEASL